MEARKPEFKFDQWTEDKCKVLLKNDHCGKEKAVSHKYLAEMLGLNIRKSRALICHLIVDHHIPIGSTSDSGIFYIATKDEMENTRAELISRICNMKKRVDALEDAYYRSIGNSPRLFEENR